MYIFVATLLWSLSAGAQTLATVGNSKITVEEFNHRFDEVKKTSNPPTAESFLDDLVRFKMGLQEADRLKLAQDPIVKERFEQVLYNSLLEKTLGAKVEAIQVNDGEMRAFYKKNPELHVAHILIEVKDKATPDEREGVKKRAATIFEEVRKAKRPFEELVKLYSDDIPTKEMGGDIGFQSRVTLAPNIFETANAMRVGEIKGLIESRAGFHILKLIEKHGYEMADKRQIRAAVFDEKRAKLFAEYFDKLKKQYRVDINKDVFKSIRK